MANPLLLGQNLANYTVTATSSQAAYPSANLLSYYPDEVWKSDSLSNAQTVVIDLGMPRSIDSVLIQTHNLASMIAGGEAINIECSANGTDWTNVYAWDDAGPTADPVYATFTVQSKRYWRISFSTYGNLPVKPSIGNLIFALKLDMGAPYQYPYKWQNLRADSTVQAIALDGRVRLSQAYSPRPIWELTWRLNTNAMVTNFKAFLANVLVNLCPFYLIETIGEDQYINLVTLAKNYQAAQSISPTINDIETLQLEALMPGLGVVISGAREVPLGADVTAGQDIFVS